MRIRLPLQQALRSLGPVLLRLKEQGVVALETENEGSVIDMDRVRVRLLVVP